MYKRQGIWTAQRGQYKTWHLAFPVGISGHGIGISGHGISGASIFKLSFKIILFLIISLSEFEGKFEIFFCCFEVKF